MLIVSAIAPAQDAAFNRSAGGAGGLPVLVPDADQSLESELCVGSLADHIRHPHVHVQTDPLT